MNGLEIVGIILAAAGLAALWLRGPKEQPEQERPFTSWWPWLFVLLATLTRNS